MQSNYTTIALVLASLVSGAVFSHGPHPDIVQKINALSNKTDQRFSETSDAINHSTDRLLQKIEDTNSRQVSTAKKISDTTIAALEAMSQGNEQVQKSSTSVDAITESAVQFGGTSIPDRLSRDISDKKSIQKGALESAEFIKSLKKHLLLIEGLSVEDYKNTLSAMNKSLSNNTGVDNFKDGALTFLYDNESQISKDSIGQIATIIHRLVKSEKAPVIPKKVLLTNEGVLQQAAIDNTVSAQNLIENMFVDAFAGIIQTSSGSSNVKTIKDAVTDRFLTSAQEITKKNYVGALRSIYESVSLHNLLLVQMLEESKKQTLLLMIRESSVLNNDLQVIKSKVQGLTQ